MFRLSGGGNDFLALAEPASPPARDDIRAWCARGVSLGADGLFTLARHGLGRVVMTYWNGDGSDADLCLNGTRCAARLAFQLGWAAGEVVVETGAGPFRAWPVDNTTIEIELPPPSFGPVERSPVVEGTARAGLFVQAGVPHFLRGVEGCLGAAPVASEGPALRRHPEFGPNGTNVDWVRAISPHELEIRTFERGVEGETLACGSGVMAATIAGLATGTLAFPVEVLTAGGFRFRLDGKAGPNGLPVSWRLAGDARLLAELTPEPGASRVPTPARWTP